MLNFKVAENKCVVLSLDIWKQLDEVARAHQSAVSRVDALSADELAAVAHKQIGWSSNCDNFLLLSTRYSMRNRLFVQIFYAESQCFLSCF
jgi:hypothetical protein